MLWYTFAENPHVISDFYTEVPLLQRVELVEVALAERGTPMSLKIVLPSFPDKAPQKWKENGYNTAQVQLDFLGLEEVKITQWSTSNFANLKLETLAHGHVVVSVASVSCNIQAKADSFKIGKVIGYLVRGRTTLDGGKR